MEYFARDHSVLKRFAKDPATGAPITDDAIDNILRSRAQFSALDMQVRRRTSVCTHVTLTSNDPFLAEYPTVPNLVRFDGSIFLQRRGRQVPVVRGRCAIFANKGKIECANRPDFEEIYTPQDFPFCSPLGYDAVSSSSLSLLSTSLLACLQNQLTREACSLLCRHGPSHTSWATAEATTRTLLLKLMPRTSGTKNSPGTHSAGMPHGSSFLTPSC